MKNNTTLEQETTRFLKKIGATERSVTNSEYEVGVFHTHHGSDLIGITINGNKKSEIINVSKDVIMEIDNHPCRDQLVKAIFKIDNSSSGRQFWQWLTQQEQDEK